ncbi:hypothetical protein U14_03428 [Candidatus Moduliflexus flocculans]|uniref:ThuA-like domain-containing protein n=1 Tax=Candidatus Moduliflexus flocculans TaxID=1499966 RepID=A0A081BP61_9BACT|nr:hypothetical protein U14_03428 [Candidatus Moduliflexus flocculans]
MNTPIRVVVWNEFRHEQTHPVVKELYPDGMHQAIAKSLSSQEGFSVSTATLDEPEHGLTEARIAETDALIWWAHIAHHEVNDEVVDRVQKAVLGGMGLIVLHSGHFSKIFKRLMGTSCALKWREAGEKERLWNVAPFHPITQGIGDYFELPQTEMYGEPFGIPEPDQTIFLSWFEGGEVFRSGCAWQRGQGKVFYFRPGHETYPIYYNENVLRVIANAVRWAYQPVKIADPSACPNIKTPLEPLKTDK